MGRMAWGVSRISIHAPTRGATQLVGVILSMYQFQSTLPRGERQNRLVNLLAYCLISIHAPTRGVTTGLKVIPTSVIYFNPRSHEGSDYFAADFADLKIRFQSTLPRGERLVIPFAYRTLSKISIHAPTRGATSIFAKKFSFLSAKIV